MSQKTAKLVNAQIVSRYAKLASSSASDERAFIIWAGHLPITVRVMAASLKKAAEGGSAPTVRPSHAQDIARAALILETVSGADKAPVREVLTLATRIRKGSDATPDSSAGQVADDFIAHMVAKGADFAALKDVAPVSNKSEGEKATATRKPATVGELATVALAQLDAILEGSDTLILSAFDLKALSDLARKCAALVKTATQAAA
jgi:hypothetical protein